MTAKNELETVLIEMQLVSELESLDVPTDSLREDLNKKLDLPRVDIIALIQRD